MSGDEEETHGFMDVTHNVCCCISPEAVAEGKREAYNQGAKDALEELSESLDSGNTMPQTYVQIAKLRRQIERGEWALRLALTHVEELSFAWERGAISEHDGMGGTRSNRNLDTERRAR
jgi:hypothetical protein